jgi:hypothetical protein
MRKFISLIVIALVIAALSFVTPFSGGRTSAQEVVPTLFTPATPSDIALQSAVRAETDPPLVRSRYVSLNFDRLQTQTQVGIDQIRLNLFDGMEYIATLERIEQHYVDPTGYIWRGTIEGIPFSEVTLTVANGQASGLVTVNEHVIEINHLSEGVHVINQIDPNYIFPDTVTPAPETFTSQALIPQPAGHKAIIDLLVVPTARATNAAGGSNNMINQIVTAVSNANESFRNSSINAEFRLMTIYVVNYAESGNLSTDLGRLSTPNDGFMDEVFNWRNLESADVVSLITETGSDCGIAYLQRASWDNAFNVTKRSCMSGHTLTHEIGHNLGSTHDIDNAGGPGVFSYSYGYRDPLNLFRTLMAYDCGGLGCPRRNHWSDPAHSEFYFPFGDRAYGTATANNRLSISQTVFTVSMNRNPALVVDSASFSDATSCQKWADDCSLARAIELANVYPGPNTITFDTNAPELRNIGVITPSIPFQNITGDLTITAPSQGAIILRHIGTQSFSMLYVRHNVNVTLNNLVFENGLGGDGGAIKNDGTLTINNSRFTNNQSPIGGAINNTVGTLTINNSRFENNRSADGGAIRNSGMLTVIGSTFEGNQGSTKGGGILNEGMVGNLTIRDTAFTNNTAGLGGAIHNAAHMVLQNVRFSTNTAQSGGAVALNVPTASTNRSVILDSLFAANQAPVGGALWINSPLVVLNSTFERNAAIDRGGALFGQMTITSVNNTFYNNTTGNQGGGVYTLRTFIGQHNTFANNTAANGGGNLYTQGTSAQLANSLFSGGGSGNCAGSITSLGGNISSDATCTSFTQPNDRQNTDPRLTAFGNHGGTRPTVALQANSPAIGSGLNANVPLDYSDIDGDGNTTEQLPLDGRGTGFPRMIGAMVDSGAVEHPSLAQNGDFTNGMAGWTPYAVPATAIQARVQNGVLEFSRAPGSQSAVVLQNIAAPQPARTPLEASFQLGNSSASRKRVTVLVHASDFTDLQVCAFWLPPNTPLRTYRILTFTTKDWAGASLSFYASTADGQGYIQVDNVSLVPAPTWNATQSRCIDPAAPAGGSGADSPNLIDNGDFASAIALPSGNPINGWGTYSVPAGLIAWRQNAGVFEFYRTAGQSALVMQSDPTPIPANTPLEASFQLGNASAHRQRVTVLLHASDFTDLQVCTFWLGPNTALGNYSIRAFTTKAWTSGATISVYASTVTPSGWLQLDNVTMRTRPSLSLTGTECFAPGSVPSGELIVEAPVVPTQPSLEPIAQPTLPPGELPLINTPAPFEPAAQLPSEGSAGSEFTEPLTESGG